MPSKIAGTSSLLSCLDRRDRSLVPAVPDHERLHPRDPAVAADLDLGIAERGACTDPLDELLDRVSERGRGDVALHDHERGVDRSDAELLLERDEAHLRRGVVRQGANAGLRQPEVQDRRGGSQEHDDGRDEAHDRSAHDRLGDPRPDTPLPAGGVDDTAEEGEAERVDAIAEEPEQRRHESQGGEHRDEPDGQCADTEASKNGVGDEQHPRHGEHERETAEEHGTARGRARARDRVELGALRRALLAVARDDEEAVVRGDRKPHDRGHLEQEDGQVEDLAEESRKPEGDGDREERDDEGDNGRDDRPEDEHENDECGRQAEVQLAGLEILVQDPVQIHIAAALARDGRVELSTVSGGDDRDQPFRPCFAVLDEAHWKQSRAPILRHEARVTALVVAGSVVDDTGRADLPEQFADLLAECGIVDGKARRAHQDELVHELGCGIRREVLTDELVAPLGFRIGRELAVVGEIEHRDDRRNGEDEGKEPRAEGEPGMPRRAARDAFSREHRQPCV